MIGPVAREPHYCVDLVDLVDLVEPRAAVTYSAVGDAVQDGPSPRPFGLGAALRRWPWWRRTDSLGRVVAALAALVALAAGGTAVAAVRAHHPTQVETRTVVDRAVNGAPDALGCPPGRECAVRDPVGMRSAVHVIRPDLVILSAFETYDTTYATVYRRQFVARSTTTGAVVRLSSSCDPRAGLAPPSAGSGSGYSTHTSEGRTVLDSHWNGSVDRGCATQVQSHAVLPSVDDGYDDQYNYASLLRLGTDNDVRVHP